MSTSSHCDTAADELTVADLSEYFADSAVAGDEQGWLDPVVAALAGFKPTFVFVANPDGRIEFMNCPGSTPDTTEAETLAESLAERLAGEDLCIQPFGKDTPGSMGFGIRLQEGDRPVLLGGVLTTPQGADSALARSRTTLAAAGRVARKAFANEQRIAELQTRSGHLEAEQDTLKASHSDAIANMIQEREERLQEHEQRLREQKETRDITVFSLAKLAESRDPETGAHLERIRSYSHILATTLRELGHFADEIDDEFLESLYLSSPLHDIGKVGIPDVILLNPGRLSTSEFEIMKRHTTIGAEALDEAAKRSGSGGFLKMAVQIALCHHERLDGDGYPAGLAGDDIPLPARIVALADVYDALTSVRVYKAAFEPGVAKKMIEQQEGKQFDSVVMGAFRAAYDRFRKVERHPDGAPWMGDPKTDDIRR